MEWLTNTGRLKSEDQPNGLIPGEAASALLIDNEHTPVTTVQLLAQATESETYATANHSFASALTQIWRHLPVDPSADTSCTTLFNHTGEHYFAHEWAYLANNAAAESPQLNLTPQFPFIDFGDVGITYSSLGLIQTAIAKQRNYQTDEHTLILSSSTDALRTGMYVHHNELMRKTHD